MGSTDENLTMHAGAIDAEFWRLFGRVLGRPLAPGQYRREELAQWDSLRHVELIFELEETFRIEIPPDAIAPLFSDTDTVRAFVHQRVTVPR